MGYVFCIIGSVLLCVAGYWFIKSFRKAETGRALDKRLLPDLTDWDRKLMAFHEAGHAVCSFYLPEREPLVKITIDPSSDAFGMIQTEARPQHNETIISLNSTIATFLAGRIAEEMFCNEITTSCIHDLNTVQTIAADMVLKFGMGRKTKFANMQAYSGQFIGPQTARNIEEDIRNIIEDAETSARTVLASHKNEVMDLAQALLCKNTLRTSEINLFFARVKQADDQ